MAWLSKGVEALVDDLEKDPSRFDVVVVGSGYGGAVAACRLAEAGYKVCVLERGEEYVPGEFPNDVSNLPRHIRIQRADRSGVIGPRRGLFDIRLHGSVTTLVGSALGGTSQINANVALEADPASFAAHWPKAFARGIDRRYYQKVKEMLGVAPYPADRPRTKAKELKRLKWALMLRLRWARFFYPALAVNYEDRTSDDGVPRAKCTGCGDCVTGCNVGAKNTLTMNYLPRAHRHGARFFTGASVLAVDPRERDCATVYFTYTDYDANRLKWKALKVGREAGLFKITAKFVVLAAGAIGSTEILLRSRELGFVAPLAQLGKRFSGNGDGLHFGFDQRRAVNAVGWGAREGTSVAPGPSIIGALEVRRGKRMLIEDGIVPGALAHAAHELMTTASFFSRLGSFRLKRRARGRDPLARDDEALRRTQVYLAMGHDSAGGVVSLKEGAAYVSWQGAASEPFVKQQEKCIRVSGKWPIGGTYLRNPALQPLPEALRSLAPDQALGGTTLVVHPLGGCPMGDDDKTGVVDHLGAVFDGQGATYGSLFVWDGAIVPTSLGANPFLTIAALAERAVEALVEQRQDAGTPSDDEVPLLPVIAPIKVDAPKTPLLLKETMRARLTLADATSAPAALHLEMPVPELARFLESRSDRIIGGITGTLDCPKLHTGPLEVHGKMELFAREPRTPLEKISGTWRALRTWYEKRGRVEICQFMNDLKSRKPGGPGLGSLGRILKGMLVLAYHASEVRKLRYELALRQGGEGGISYTLRGEKTVRFAVDSNVWDSLLDLPVVIRDDRGVVARGTFRLDLLSLSEEDMPQIEGTVDLPNALSHLAGLPLVFLRVMLKLHLWDFRAPDYRTPQAVPRFVASVEFPKGGALEGEPHRIKAGAGSLGDEGETIDLRLTRFRREWLAGGADAGGTPVLLLHGYAQSSRAFAAPKLSEDLIRHLLARNFDVWLLDYRTSTALPTVHEQCLLDDVARYDIPAAVDYILKVTERPGGQILALGHCMGAATLAMSLLAGRLKHEGLGGQPKIRAAVLSQVPPLIVGGYYSQYRRELAAFGRNVLGLRHINFAADSNAGPWEKLMDRVFATLPVTVEDEPYGKRTVDDCRSIVGKEPRTDIATCKRVAGIIGPLYLHENIKQSHEYLHEWFGLGSISILAHVAKFFEYERLVSADGANFYVTDANIRSHLQLPIALLHGDRNQVFDYESAKQSRDAINRVRGPDACQLLDITGHYAHFDCLIGDNAYREVYPAVSRFFLDQLNPIRPGTRHRHDPEPFPYRPAPEDRPSPRLDA